MSLPKSPPLEVSPMYRTLAVFLPLVLLLLSGCPEARPPVDQVQANAIAKVGDEAFCLLAWGGHRV